MWLYISWIACSNIFQVLSAYLGSTTTRCLNASIWKFLFFWLPISSKTLISPPIPQSKTSDPKSNGEAASDPIIKKLLAEMEQSDASWNQINRKECFSWGLLYRLSWNLGARVRNGWWLVELGLVSGTRNMEGFRRDARYNRWTKQKVSFYYKIWGKMEGGMVSAFPPIRFFHWPHVSRLNILSAPHELQVIANTGK